MKFTKSFSKQVNFKMTPPGQVKSVFGDNNSFPMFYWNGKKKIGGKKERDLQTLDFDYMGQPEIYANESLALVTREAAEKEQEVSGTVTLYCVDCGFTAKTNMGGSAKFQFCESGVEVQR